MAESIARGAARSGVLPASPNTYTHPHTQPQENMDTKVEGNERNGGPKIWVNRWSPEEDAKLKKLVARFGPKKWTNIAQHVPGRSDRSCRLRWVEHLCPGIKRCPFSEEEDNKLIAAQKRYGNKWTMISKLLPGRTDKTVMTRWHRIMARGPRNMPLSNNNAAIESTTMSTEKNQASESQIGFIDFLGVGDT